MWDYVRREKLETELRKYYLLKVVSYISVIILCSSIEHLSLNKI